MSIYLKFLEHMEALGYKTKVVYDIGACQAAWSKELKTNFKNVEIILFEANPAYKTALENSGFKFFNDALSNPGRKYVDFYNGTNTGDSYYKETTKYYDEQSSIRLTCKTLDEIVEKNHLPIPNLIKIDTQGSELDILNGAQLIIDKVDFIYIELPIIRYNEGAPNISEYLEFFRSKNYVPIDIFEIHRAENILLQIDIMFVRSVVKEKYLGPSEFIRPFA